MSRLHGNAPLSWLNRRRPRLQQRRKSVLTHGVVFCPVQCFFWFCFWFWSNGSNLLCVVDLIWAVLVSKWYFFFFYMHFKQSYRSFKSLHRLTFQSWFKHLTLVSLCRTKTHVHSCKRCIQGLLFKSTLLLHSSALVISSICSRWPQPTQTHMYFLLGIIVSLWRLDKAIIHVCICLFFLLCMIFL